MCVLQTPLGKKRKVAEVNSSDLRHIVVAHSGQSSQLFVYATGRNAQFLQQLRGVPSAVNRLALVSDTCVRGLWPSRGGSSQPFRVILGSANV
jgi:hypothetical protein